MLTSGTAEVVDSPVSLDALPDGILTSIVRAVKLIRDIEKSLENLSCTSRHIRSLCLPFLFNLVDSKIVLWDSVE